MESYNLQIFWTREGGKEERRKEAGGSKSSRQMRVHKTGRKERRQEERERTVKGELCASDWLPCCFSSLLWTHKPGKREQGPRSPASVDSRGSGSVKLAQGRPQGLGGGVGLWNSKGGRDFSELEPEGSCSSSQQLFWK